MAKQVPNKIKNLIWSDAAGRCSFTNCRIECITREENDEPSLIGEIAHISALSKGGPRFDVDMSGDERKSPKNLMLLCPNHHRKIDKNVNTYSVEDLKKMKANHESWVQECLQEETMAINFSQLETTMRAIVSTLASSSDELSLDLTEITTKINKNNLGPKTKGKITMGLARATEVEDFLKDIKKSIPDFSEKLKKGLTDKYNELVNSDLNGDELFNEMHNFCSCQSNDFEKMSAGLVILVYFFEKCEVFEK